MNIINLAVRVIEACFILGWLYSCTGTSLGLQTKSGNSACNPHGEAARSDVGPRVTHVLGIVVVNLCGASGKTLYWVLLLGYVRPPGNYWVLLLVMQGFGQHTLLGIIRSDVRRFHQCSK
jgi:hypothetical protein